MSPDADPAAAAPPALQDSAAAVVHFGGPDMPPRALRNLLAAHIEAAPPGSEIIWATYYFRDQGLADALVAAHRRGVRVRVIVDGRPRRRDANAAVVAKLREGLGAGFRAYRSVIPGARMHTKIYAFSGPAPRVFVGSFNPSGDVPEDPAVLADIGDQDRGHNLLVQLAHPAAVQEARAQAERIWRDRGVSRFSHRQNTAVRAGPFSFFYFPRLEPDVVETSLLDLGRGDSVRAAISHIEGGPLAARLAAAARRGADVDLVVHDTARRVPIGLIASLRRAGVSIRRYCHPDGLPMHAKFVLVEDDGQRMAWFGSLNFNANSRFLNQELLVRSREPALVARLETRFTQIRDEAITLAQARQDPVSRVQLASLSANESFAVAAPRPGSGYRVTPLTRACAAPAADGPPRRIWATVIGWLKTGWTSLKAWLGLSPARIPPIARLAPRDHLP